MRFTRNYGMMCLAAFLVLHGLVVLLSLNFSYRAEVEAILAIAAGVLIFLDR